MLGFPRGFGGTSILSLGLALVLAGCGQDAQRTAERTAGETRDRAEEMAGRDRQAGDTIQRINSDPQNYYGKTVTVSGEVDKVMNPHAVQISGEGMMQNDMLVVSKRNFSDVARRNLAENDRLQVSGTVRQFRIAEIEKEIGFDLDDQAFSDWNDKPVLIANNVTVTPAGQGTAGRQY